ncbi:MAG: hypothetical protein AB8B96_07815 [Lysobacterales bacterium]
MWNFAPLTSQITQPITAQRRSIGLVTGLCALLITPASWSLEFERMPTAQYRQTINKAHKAYRSERMEEALALYNLTARWGEPDSQRQLGIMLISGEGTEVDLVEGMAWIHLAAKTKRRADLDVLKQAKAQLPKDAVDAGAELAQEYAPQFGAKATGVRCKRRRLKDSGRKEVVCERGTGGMTDSSTVEVPVVDSQYYWAIE